MHFSDKVIPKPYEKVKAVLKNAEFMALTTDGWTSRSLEGYITVTAHFIHEWEIKNYILQTRRMDQSHTPREGLAACSAKEVPSFLSHFKTLSNGPAPRIEPATSRSAVKRPTD